MRMTDRYVRRGIAAVREGRIDPDPLVKCWIGSLRDLLARPSHSETAAGAVAASTYWARLLRVRPELLDAQAETLLEEAERRMARAGSQAIISAARAADLAGWLDGARRLAASYDAVPNAAEQARQARELIAALDDAELVSYAAVRLSRGMVEEAEGLDACRLWLRDQAADFLPAAEDVLAIGAAMRPDLPEFDPELALTAEKYIWLLDDAEDAEAEFAMSGPPLFDARALRAFVERSPAEAGGLSPRPLAETRAWLPSAAYAIAAAEQKAASSHRVYSWTAPDGSLTAWLMIPPTLRGTDDDRLCVEFREVDSAQSPAARMAGTQVSLADVSAQIDQGGMAFFRLGDLRPGESSGPALAVGNPLVAWPLQG